LGSYTILIQQPLYRSTVWDIEWNFRSPNLKPEDLLGDMAEKKDGKYWFLFSIADVIFIIVLVGILSSGGKLLADPDVGLHIRAGEYIIDNFTIPTHDIFSHTIPPPAWTAHEWLAELIFAILYKPFGLTGVGIFMALLITAIYAILFKFLRSSGVSILVAFLTVLLAAGASTIHWLARPHMFSLLLLLIWYMVLDTYQYKHKNYLYLLPFIMVLWVNHHGSFVMGFMLLLVYIAGNFLIASFAKEKRSEAHRRTKILFSFFFLCILVSLLNPQGYKIFFFPFQLTTNKFITRNIIEWLSPDFHQFLIFEYMLLLLIMVLGLSVKRLNAIEVILLLLFTHLALFAGRYIPLFAVIVSPIVGKQVDRIIEELKGKGPFKEIILTSDNMAAVDSLTKWHLWSVAAMAVAIFLCFTGKLEYRFDKKTMPVDAAQFLRDEKIEGKVFDSFDFGSYLIYAAWPQIEVFIDGRADMYSKEHTDEYLKVVSVKRGWQEILKKYDIRCIIYNNGSPLSNVLLETDDWHLIYSDPVANIFVKKMPENQPLINKYPNVKPVAAAKRDD
jgi:hypothetical protein